MAAITLESGETREVKNLGWLLRHNSEVHSFIVGYGPVKGHGAHLRAHMNSTCRATRYDTLFASRSILKDWLDRPVFQGLTVNWFGTYYIIGSPEYREEI